MASVRKEIVIDASAERVWDVLRDWGSPHVRLVPGFATDARLDGEDRIVTFFNAGVREPCERYGEEVMAWVRLHEGATATAEDLIAACRGRIATYKIPRHWKFIDSFPMTVTGKTQKYRMRQIAIEELGLQGAA